MSGPRRSARVLAAAALAAALAVAPESARADDDEKGALGLGLLVGEPTGVSGKLYLTDDQAIAAGVGGAVVVRGIQAHADYLFHPWILESTETFVLPAYVGPGLRALSHDRGAGLDDAFHLGPRATVGLLFDFREVPLDVFVEVAGIFEYRFSSDDDHRGFGFDLNAGAGIRYYF